MMDWSDRHCRFYFRQLAPHARLYTEMVTTGALLRGNAPRHLRFDPIEHPVALQLGGSEPSELARCAQLAQQWGYDEVNLNCGCPSPRVQRGVFGACLMSEPSLVAHCIKAMREAVSIPVTVKHRLGLDDTEDYAFTRRFVDTLAAAGCEVFLVHARNAVLKGLSPSDNRQIPPLRYTDVYRLKREFPEVTVVLNGGIDTVDDACSHLRHVDGVMLGRAAYHDAYLLAQLDAELWQTEPISRKRVAERMFCYARQQVLEGVPLRAVTRHLLGLFHQCPGARQWRRLLSDSSALRGNEPGVILQALAATEREILEVQ